MASGRNQSSTRRGSIVIFRNRLGVQIDAEQAEAMLREDGLEVATDQFVFDGQQVLVRSRLQPVSHDEFSPLYLTMVFGDSERGLQEYPTNSEEECRQFHRTIVDRFLLVERARQEETPRVLLEGAL